MGIPGAIEDIRPFAELAQNATTVVYKAYQSSLERFVLLKRLRTEFSSDQDLSARFQEEARIAARVKHPNVVSIYAFGSDDEGAYIVAEFIEGLDLGELIERGRIPPDVALYILLEAAKGLKAAHDKDVLHRDLKPSNILVSHEGEVKLTDFGLASISGSSTENASEIRGTLSYLAPEQILGEPLDRRCDLFSLGATFFEMLTGRRAFPGSEPQEILDAVLNRDPRTFLSATAGVTSEIEAIGSKLWARDPDDRFSSADELIDAVASLREARAETIGAQDLRAYLDDPRPFAVPAASVSEDAQPDVTVVPDRRSEQSPSDVEELRRDGRLVRRTAMLAGLLVFAAAVVFAGVEILGGSGASEEDAPREEIEGEFVRDDVSADTAATPIGEVAPEESQAVEETEEQEDGREPAVAEAASEPPPVDREQPPPSEVPETPDRGVLKIRVEPWAGVFMGGDSLGRSNTSTPVVTELDAGSHRLSLRNPFFPRLPHDVDIRAGDTTLVDLSLWSLVGRLELHVSPWANVFVDGRYVGQTPLSDPLILLPGVRQIRLVNPELNVERTYSVTIARGDELREEYILTGDE